MDMIALCRSALQINRISDRYSATISFSDMTRIVQKREGYILTGGTVVLQ
jgi:hypothetical protein